MKNKFPALSLSAFQIKIIAVTAMMLDHMRVAFPDVFPLWFRVVGRLAFPLFAYLIADGFRHTRSPGKFLARLAVFALISEPFFDIAFGNAATWRDVNFLSDTNIFYTLFLGGAAISLYRYTVLRGSLLRGKSLFGDFLHGGSKWVAIIICIFFGGLAVALGVDFGWAGAVFIFALYAAKENRRLAVLAGMCFCIWLPLFILMLSGYELANPRMNFAFVLVTFLTVPIAACYNGKRGPDGFVLKWFFYLFYPLHLVMLAVLI
jgi:hypothetical protein